MTTPDQPAIRLTDFMGDYDELYRTKLIGPYPDVQTRDADLARLARLPLGAPEYDGGYTFTPCTMGVAAGDPDAEIVAPGRLAAVSTIEEFFIAYNRPGADAGADR